MAKGPWLEKPWVVADCDTAKIYNFDTRVEAEKWVRSQNESGLLLLYPDSAFRILSASEVRAIGAVGATLFDDFGETGRWRD